MKIFLNKLLVFFLPFLVLYPILETRLSQIPNYYNQKKEYLNAQLGEIEILSTGSSHGNSINPQFLSRKGFNLFNDAEDIYYDIRLVEKYLDKMPNLKIIIMPISYFSLEYRIDRSPSAWRSPFYKFNWNIPPQELTSLFNLGYFSYTAAYGWREVVSYIENGFASKSTQKLDSNGWREIGDQVIIDSPEEERSGWQSVSINESLMDTGVIKGNMSLLSRFIETCQIRQIKVILITTPVYHYYYEHIDPLKYQRMQENLDKLVNKYQLSYYNFLKDSRFATTDFYNRDHLNASGVEKFSKILDTIISKELNPIY
jgi:hypothetical protein